MYEFDQFHFMTFFKNLGIFYEIIQHLFGTVSPFIVSKRTSYIENFWSNFTLQTIKFIEILNNNSMIFFRGMGNSLLIPFSVKD